MWCFMRAWRRVRRGILYAAVGMIVVVSLAPVAWLFISSMSPDVELNSSTPHWIPQHPTTIRYRALFSEGASDGLKALGPSMEHVAGDFRAAFRNSLVVVLSSTVASLALGVLAAYGLVRFSFPGRDALWFLSMGTRALPPISLVIPLYLLLRQLDLLDTYYALILTYSAYLLPIVIWIMGNFFRTVPKELEEAAVVDGCTPFGALWRVVIPLAGPGMAAAGIVCMLLAWDEFLFALIFTETLASKTLPVALSEFSTDFGGLDFGLIATGGTLMCLPPILIALLFQRYLVSGLTGGAVKG